MRMPEGSIGCEMGRGGHTRGWSSSEGNHDTGSTAMIVISWLGRSRPYRAWRVGVSRGMGMVGCPCLHDAAGEGNGNAGGRDETDARQSLVGAVEGREGEGVGCLCQRQGAA
jgi:hypothetical protein